MSRQSWARLPSITPVRTGAKVEEALAEKAMAEIAPAVADLVEEDKVEDQVAAIREAEGDREADPELWLNHKLDTFLFFQGS